jgi:4-hydroxy-tetrahydrodipicolinate reductase
VIRVVVAGAAGRMGEAACEAVAQTSDMELVAGVDTARGTKLADALAGARGDVDVVVDFTQPDAVLGNVATCLEAGVHSVVGTTGFDMAELERLSEQARANVFVAPNFAIGAVLMMRFATEAAPHMAKAEIIELHHDRKLDAPSGTAKRTAELMASAAGGPPPPIHSVRLPGLVANQEVILGEVGQTLTIRHDTTSREAFMPGVLLAVRRVGELPERLTVGLEALLFRA